MICLNALWLAPVILLAVLIVPHMTDRYTGKYGRVNMSPPDVNMDVSNSQNREEV